MSTRAKDQAEKRKKLWAAEVLELLKLKPHLSVVRQWASGATEVEATCPFCEKSKRRAVLANVTIIRWLRQRELIQRLLPDADEDVCEALMSGICPPCWEGM